jgi:hypothetical protein
VERCPITKRVNFELKNNVLVKFVKNYQPPAEEVEEVFAA